MGISVENLINICKLANCSSIAIFNGIIKSPNTVENYELLNDRDKAIINQMIAYLLNTNNKFTNIYRGIYLLVFFIFFKFFYKIFFSFNLFFYFF